MKTYVLSLLAVLSLGVALVGSPAFAASSVKLITYEPSKVFTPRGFDNNDNAQIVLDGIFPNTCYKVSEPIVKVDLTNKKIHVKDQALHFTNTVCLYMLVQYFKPINLGVLPEGKYEILVEDKDGNVKKDADLNIAKANSVSPDEHLYAPVEEAWVDQSGQIPVLVLRGHFTQSCLRMKEVLMNDYPDLIEVLPIAEQVPGVACSDALVPYEERVPLKGGQTGRVLVHIRSLNGQSVNRVLNL